MDGPRNYQDESDGRWYSGYAERYPAVDSRFEDDERHRVPEPRYSEPGEAGGESGRFREGYPEAEAYGSRSDPGLAARSASPTGPRSGVELPPLPPPADLSDSRFHDSTESRFHQEQVEPRFHQEQVEPRFHQEQVEPRFHQEQAEPRFHAEGPESRFQTEPIDRAALRRAPGSVGAPTQLAPPIQTQPINPPPIQAGPPMQAATPMQAGPMQGNPPPPLGPAGGGMPGPASQPAPPMPVDQSGAVYRSRHTGAAILLVVVAILAELLTVRMLFSGEFGHPFQPAEVLGGIFTMGGTPLVAMGLYGLITGAANASGPAPGRAWLRPPLAFLPIGLALIVAGALAI
ncbi:hypothetical protein GCM10023322_17760 [Rugosimonospora acidiphila]|uniref:Uncharacterized protein n=1 Tax=Rugosimonospora acidiphila TaxID=556531 RepID=A0ABP9RPR0_9ACTN